MSTEPNNKERIIGISFTLGISMGIAIGMVIGLVTDNIGLWMPIGEVPSKSV